MQQNIMSEEKILEWITESEPGNIYIIDRETGIVYHRNEGFEAGFGNLYEILGRLKPEVIAAHEKEMNPDYVSFINEEKREELQRAINTCWVASINLAEISKYSK